MSHGLGVQNRSSVCVCVAVLHLNVIQIAPGHKKMHPHTRTENIRPHRNAKLIHPIPRRFIFDSHRNIKMIRQALSCMLPETRPHSRNSRRDTATPACSCLRFSMLLSETDSETSTPAPTSAPIPPTQWQLPLLLLHAAP